MFRTVTSPPSGASSHKLYNALVCSCYQASLAVAWMYIQATARHPYSLVKTVTIYHMAWWLLVFYSSYVAAEDSDMKKYCRVNLQILQYVPLMKTVT